MSARYVALLAALALALVGCTTVNTLPEVRGPTSLPDEIVFDLPQGYVIESVDFEAAPDSNGTMGRSFIEVLAREVRTGEQVLFLYENFQGRTAPVSIIRFRRVEAARR